jgi:hypothetical protein
MTMQACATNRDSQDVRPAIFSSFTQGTNSVSLETRLDWFSVESDLKLIFRNFDSYIGMELSLVPEVETVFVKADNENGKSYTVFTVINARDPEVRAKVYAREVAIMDAARGIDFSFRVISRMNRNMREVIDNAGTLVFKR